MKGRRLAFKFVVITLTTSAVVSTLVAVSFATFQHRKIRREIAETRAILYRERLDTARLLHRGLESKGAGLADFVAKLAPDAIEAHDSARLESYVSQVGLDGEVLFAAVFDTEDKLLTLPPPPTNSATAYVVVRPCIGEDDVRYGRIMIGLSRTNTLQALARSDATVADAMEQAEARERRATGELFRGIVAASFLGTMLLSGILYVVFNRTVSRPVTRVAGTLRKIAGGDFSQRLPPMPDDEIGDLAVSFNQMAAEIQATTVSRDELAREVEERKRANAHFRNLIERSPFGILLVSRDKEIVDANDAALRLLGHSRDEVIGRDCRKLVCSVCEGECPILDKGQTIDTSEQTAVRATGEEFPILKSVAEVRIDGDRFLIESFIDISERKRAEAERLRLESRIMHAQKLESLGVLAGGIAHDFNNILMAILGNVELAGDALSELSPARPYLQSIRSSATRAAELSNQMLAYSGKGRFIIKPIDLNELVTEISHLMEAAISKKAALKHELSGVIPAVEVDSAQIQQVVMNLITNASDALEESSGLITISTGIVNGDQPADGEFVPLPPDDGCGTRRYVFLEVADTGCGMDDETRAKIFDPFFTTKFTGRGLGLAAVQGIVQGHRGTITVQSAPGAGTTVRVLLPPSTKEPLHKPPTPPRVRGPAKVSGNVVLVVDDEHMLRSVAERALANWGFKVLTAADGQEGVDVFREHAEEIDAIVLDLAMPRMSGEETLREIRHIRPDVPAILYSGFDQEETMERVSSLGVSACLQKPFSMDTLAGELKAIVTRTTETADVVVTPAE